MPPSCCSWLRELPQHGDSIQGWGKGSQKEVPNLSFLMEIFQRFELQFESRDPGSNPSMTQQCQHHIFHLLKDSFLPPLLQAMGCTRQKLLLPPVKPVCPRTAGMHRKKCSPCGQGIDLGGSTRTTKLTELPNQTAIISTLDLLATILPVTPSQSPCQEGCKGDSCSP